MSAVNEAVVREYFEGLGFMVSQPRKHSVPGRRKRAEDELDFLLHHPGVKEQKVPSYLEWSTKDLSGISRAAVAVRGWHTERFSESTFRQSPDILAFAEPDVKRFATRALGSPSFVNILCLPGLPSTGELRNKTLTLLRAKGIDGILSFRDILLDLIQSVDVKRNYDRSDVLQMIRIIKSYDLLKDPQMEFFENRLHRKPAKRAGANPAGSEAGAS